MQRLIRGAGARATIRVAAGLVIVIGYLDLVAGGIVIAPLALVAGHLILVPLALLTD